MLQGRGPGELRAGDGRTKVREDAEPGPELEQSPLGPERALDPIPLRASHRSEQDGVAGAGALERLPGQRLSAGVDGLSADRRALDLEVRASASRQGFQDLHRLGDDLRTDAVAGQHQNLSAHVASSTGDAEKG